MEGLIGKMYRVQIFHSQEEETFFYEKIQPIEHYQFKEKNSEYAWIEFDYKKCFPLSVFIEGLKTRYLRVYEGQLRILAHKIYCHLNDLRNQNINHGNLEQKNVIIQVGDESQNFATYARQVEIKQIYFTNYQLDQSKIAESDDSLSLNRIIAILFSDKKQYDVQLPLISQDWLELRQILSEKLKGVNPNQKIENVDQEDGYTSSRYISQKKYGNYLEEIKKIFDELDKKIENEVKQSEQDQIQIEELGEKAISIIQIKSNKDQEIERLGDEKTQIMHKNMIIEVTSDDDSNQINKEDPQIIQQNKLKKQINEAKCSLCKNIKFLFLNRFYEEAVTYEMQGIGDFICSNSYIASYSSQLSQEKINTSFIIQLENFQILFKEITLIENNFKSIFNELIENHFNMFKFQIDLDPSEILSVYNNQIIKFIMHNQLIEKKQNYMGDANFAQFQNHQKETLRSSMSELISLLQQIQILKIMSEQI